MSCQEIYYYFSHVAEPLAVALGNGGGRTIIANHLRTIARPQNKEAKQDTYGDVVAAAGNGGLLVQNRYMAVIKIK